MMDTTFERQLDKKSGCRFCVRTIGHKDDVCLECAKFLS